MVLTLSWLNVENFLFIQFETQPNTHHIVSYKNKVYELNETAVLM